MAAATADGCLNSSTTETSIAASRTADGATCLMRSITLANKIAERGYTWCTLEEDLRLRLAWVDDGVGYMSAFYGGDKWSRFYDNTIILLMLQRAAFVVVSVIGNARILWYHWTTPAHPKFSVSMGSRVAIAVHVLSGTIGVAAPLVPFLFQLRPSEGRVIMIIALAVEVTHSSTALKMIPNLFGTKVIMTPAYVTCVGTKLGLAVGLLISLVHEPVGGYKEQIEWLWAWWCAHNTYAWVRLAEGDTATD
jgi:hypothetical protein